MQLTDFPCSNSSNRTVAAATAAGDDNNKLCRSSLLQFDGISIGKRKNKLDDCGNFCSNDSSFGAINYNHRSWQQCSRLKGLVRKARDMPPCKRTISIATILEPFSYSV